MSFLLFNVCSFVQFSVHSSPLFLSLSTHDTLDFAFLRRLFNFFAIIFRHAVCIFPRRVFMMVREIAIAGSETPGTENAVHLLRLSHFSTLFPPASALLPPSLQLSFSIWYYSHSFLPFRGAALFSGQSVYRLYDFFVLYCVTFRCVL